MVYVKPSVIKAVLNAPCFTSVFERVHDTKRNSIIRLRPEVDGKRTKAKLRHAAKEEVRTVFDHLKRLVSDANDDIAKYSLVSGSRYIRLRDFGIDLKEYGLNLSDKPLPLIEYNQKTLDSCSLLAQDYGIDSVISAVKTICRNAINGLISIKKASDLGGLIRTVLTEKIGLAPAS